MIWTAQICVSDKAPLDTAIGSQAIEMSGIDDERAILCKALEFWLYCFPALVAVDTVPLPGRYPVADYEKFEASMHAPRKPYPPLRKHPDHEALEP